jgi:hypothetical protein
MHVGMLAAMGQIELDEVRKIALALPEVNERLSHGALCFFIQDRRPLCYYHDNHCGVRPCGRPCQNGKSHGLRLIGLSR